MTKSHVLLLDADYLIFSSMSAAETETRWDDNVWTLECCHETAWRNLISAVNGIKRIYKEWADSPVLMALTADTNWRKDVLPTYKMNRKATRKPLGYSAFVERVQACKDWVAVSSPSLEGDDILGIYGSNPSLIGKDSATIVSPDKDFKTIPCEFYHMSAQKLYQITEEEADRYHMYQTLIGDVTDGYKGVVGLGAKVAEEFLDAPYLYEQQGRVMKTGKRKGEVVSEWKKKARTTETLWECMVSLAAKYGTSEDELLRQARVARILRSTDIEYGAGSEGLSSVKLWTPPAN